MSDRKLIWRSDLKWFGEPLEDQVFTPSGPVDDQKDAIAVQRGEREMPDAASVVDALTTSDSKSGNSVGIELSSGGDDDQHRCIPERRDRLAAKRMAFHHLDSERERATFGAH